MEIVTNETESKPCSCNDSVITINNESNSKLNRREFFYLLFCLIALVAVGGFFIYKKLDVFWWFLLFLLIIPYSGYMGYTIAKLTEEEEIKEEDIVFSAQ
jgi:hypothetical protein